MVLQDVKNQIEKCLLALYVEDIKLKRYLIPNKTLQGKIFILQSLYKVFDWVQYTDYNSYKELVNSLCTCNLYEPISQKVLLQSSPIQFFQEEWVGADYCCEKYEEEWIGSDPLCELI